MINYRTAPVDMLRDRLVAVSGSFDVVTVSDVKEYAVIDTSEDDTLIETLIGVAIQHFQNRTSRYLKQQTREVVYNRRAGCYPVPALPVSAVTSFATSYEGTETTGDASNFFLKDSHPVLICGTSDAVYASPRDRVLFEYTAGYATAAAVPDDIQLAIRKIVLDLYEFRPSIETEGDIPRELAVTWKSLIEPHRLIWV